MGKKGKFEFSAKFLNMLNEHARLKHEYSEECFKEIMTKYPVLAKMSAELGVGKFIDESYNVVNDTHVKPWAFLEDVKLEDGISKEREFYRQGEMESKIETMKKTYRYVEQMTCNGYPMIDIRFTDRTHSDDMQAWAISHTIGWFKFIGDDKTYWFESPENETMSAVVTAGDCKVSKLGFLTVTHDDGKKITYGLDAFAMLSINARPENVEEGVFTAFNREFGILHVEELQGRPTLETSSLAPFVGISTDPDDYKKKKK